jgi:hypothetical protein
MIGLQPFKNLAALLIQDAQTNRPNRPRNGSCLADYVWCFCSPNLAFGENGRTASASDAKELNPESLRLGAENALQVG